MTFAGLSRRYRWHAKASVYAGAPSWQGTHSVNLVGRWWLTIRPRELRYWSIGPSLFALHGVIDFTLHFGVVSIGLKRMSGAWKAAALSKTKRTANLTVHRRIS